MNDYTSATNRRDADERVLQVGTPFEARDPQTRSTSRPWSAEDEARLQKSRAFDKEELVRIKALEARELDGLMREIPEERLSEQDVDALAERYSEGRIRRPFPANPHD